MSNRMPRAPGGWSLIEAVVALAILALVLGLVYQAIGASARRAGQVNRYIEGLTLAESKLSGSGELKRGNHSGTTARGLRWRMHIEPFAPEDLPLPSASVERERVNVEVEWDSGVGARSVALSTVRLRSAQ